MTSSLHFAGLARDRSDFMLPCVQNYPPNWIQTEAGSLVNSRGSSANVTLARS